MSHRPLILSAVAGLAIAMAAPAALRAQNITAPIRAARRAVQATNTHTAHELAPMTATRDTLSSPAQPLSSRAKPLSSRPQPLSSRAKRGISSPVRDSSHSPGMTKNDTASRIPHPASRAAYHATDAEERPSVPPLVRETFTYTADGRRDPFVSLMSSGELRPMISDLKLVAVIYDPTGHSVAVLRDLTSDEQYRVTVGKTLGRMRVTAIQPKSVTFVLDEFGYSRQEVLALNDSTTERAQ